MGDDEHDIPDDVRAFGEAEAARRTEERKAKLATLKQRIRQSGLSVIEDYPTPKPSPPPFAKTSFG